MVPNDPQVLLTFVELLVSKGVTHDLPEQILEGVWNTCAVVGKRRATPSHIQTCPQKWQVYQHPQRTNNLGTDGVGGLLKLQTEDLKVSERILANILSLSPNSPIDPG